MKQVTVENHEVYKNERANINWSGGFFIIMGIVFFLGMSEVTILGLNSWVLVALLPVYWIGVAAYKRYKAEGRFSSRVFSILVFSLLPFAYIAAAALGLNVAAIWPVGLIAVGVVIILSSSGK